MKHRLRRRPSPAMVVALLALFVALDGPATAARLIDGRTIRKNTITGRQVKNRSLTTSDLSVGTLRLLEATPAGSVGAAQLVGGAVGTGQLADGGVQTPDLADGAVTPMQLGAGAVTASKLAEGAVGGAAIADGSLQSRDIGDFSGLVQINFTMILAAKDADGQRDQNCQTGAPFRPAGADGRDVRDDVILVTPPVGWPDQLTVAGYPGSDNTLRIVVCNPTLRDIAIPPNVTPIFRYLAIDQ